MAYYRKAILITYPVEQAINEAISLADAAGYSIIKTVTQHQITKSRFGIGGGKAEEVKEFVEEIKPDEPAPPPEEVPWHQKFWNFIKGGL